jgi:hypothetical protein
LRDTVERLPVKLNRNALYTLRLRMSFSENRCPLFRDMR